MSSWLYWSDVADVADVAVDCCQIHQADKQTVQLPTTVIAACRITSQLRAIALSKKCQVQAHIALTKAGSIANDIVRHAR